MDSEEKIKNTIEAGKAAKRVRDSLKVKIGDRYSDICERLEGMMKDLGCEYAFPINISVNEITAHDTASLKEDRTITEKDLVKIDIGVHKNGFIADGAVTFDMTGEYGNLMDVSNEALENAISEVKAGVDVSRLGAVIGQTVKKRGLKVIENLTGHGLEQYTIHSDPMIPNYEIQKGIILREGDVIAIEPFITTADSDGHVTEMDRCEIFSASSFEPTRNRDARKMMERIVDERKALPFAERHYVKKPTDKIAMLELLRNGSLMAYPVLRERSGGMVAQFEHTVIVGKDAAELVF